MIDNDQQISAHKFTKGNQSLEEKKEKILHSLLFTLYNAIYGERLRVGQVSEHGVCRALLISEQYLRFSFYLLSLLVRVWPPQSLQTKLIMHGQLVARYCVC